MSSQRNHLSSEPCEISGLHEQNQRGEPAALADAIVGLLRDPGARRRLGQDGRNFVLQRYRWEDVLDRMKAIERQIGRREG